MSPMRRNFSIFTCLVLGAWFTVAGGVAQAGNKTEVTILGFSGNGKYVAYDIFGVGDPAPVAHSTIRFVNVPGNNFVGKRIVHRAQAGKDGSNNEGPPHLEKVRAQARKKGAVLFQRLGIVPGENRAEKVSFFAQAKLLSGGYQVDFSANEKKYRLELFERPYSRNSPCRRQVKDLYGTGPKIFTLRLTQSAAGKSKILQKDSKLYKSRGCVFGYALNSVHVYKNSLVVFIDAKMPGFEGPDITQLVVTGVLEFK